MNRTDRRQQPATKPQLHDISIGVTDVPDASQFIPFPAEAAPYLNPRATGRTFIEASLREAVAPVLHRARTANAFAGCLVLELEGNREIEETFGEELAGALAACVESRLLEALRCVDVVQPVTCDEFVILLDRLEDGEDARHIADRLRTLSSGTFDIAGMRLTLKAHIGTALYPTDAVDPGTLLRCAGVALREATLEGDECHNFAPAPWCKSCRCGE